jgi:hypothetical protein
MAVKRLTVVTLAFLVGCSGVAGGGFTPGVGAGIPASASRLGASRQTSARRGKTKVRVRLTIPRRRHGERPGGKHPSTISGFTQSVGIQVDTAPAAVFNTTPASAGCSIAPSGTTCSFEVQAPVGADTFVVSTYSAANAGGTMLDRGTAVVPIAAGKANSPVVTLGPVVTNTNDALIGSLRYAVGSANPGDTIMFDLAAGSTIALASPITISNNVSIAGPGVTTSSSSYAGISIDGANAHQIFLVSSGGTLNLSGLILTHGLAGVANQPGGAIGNQGSLTLTNDAFTQNSSSVASPLRRRHVRRDLDVRVLRSLKIRLAHMHPHNCTTTYYEGGAVYNDGTLTMTGTTFDGNVAPSNLTNCIDGEGGAIYNDVSGILTSNGNTYLHNSAIAGGAVYNDGTSGQATFSSDDFSANTGCTAFSGCPTSGCSGSACASSASGDGAAIYDNAGPGIVVSNSNFTGNVVGGSSAGSQGNGAALYLLSGSPSISGSTFGSNVAGGGTSYCSVGIGGAIVSGVNMELDGDTFTGNQAAGDASGSGGAIYAVANVTGSNDTFTSNAAAGTGSACAALPVADGGAAVVETNLSLNGSTFAGNTAISTGAAEAGALYAAGPARLSGDTFSSNRAVLTGASSGNAAAGGAIVAVASLASSNDTFNTNSVAVGTGANSGQGGAVFCNSGMTSSGDTYGSNSVTAGGLAAGGAVFESGGLTLTGGTFTSNSVTGGQAVGGALLAEATATSISASSFSANTATMTNTVANPQNIGAGGAIFDATGLSLSGSTVANNSATTNGGGILVQSSESIANSKITGNAVLASGALGGGGGIFAAGTLTVANSSISGNTVAITGTNSGGGGIYTSDGSTGLTMTQSTVSGNSVTGSAVGTPTRNGGGGIYEQGPATISNSTIAGNRSSVDGGGLDATSNTIYNVQLTQVTLFQNAASGNGGNLALGGDKLMFANSIIAGGSAVNGPDIWNEGSLWSQDYNIIQTAIYGSGIEGIVAHNKQLDPLLLSLASNGGPTMTNADQATSPGRGMIPFGTTTFCGSGGAVTATDQRGYARGATGSCDPGAYDGAATPTSARHQSLLAQRDTR